MKAKACFLYQILDLRWAVLVYYLAIFCLTLLTNISVVSMTSSLSINGEHTVIMSGLTFASGIFIFIVGLNSFTESFWFALQNGVSRRTLFLTRLATAGATALFMGLVDQLCHSLVSLAGQNLPSGWMSLSLFQQLYPQAWGNPVQGFFLSVVFGFCLLLFMANAGYAVVMLFYRLNKLGKVLVGAGVPALLIFGIPVLKALDSMYFGERLRAFGNAVVQPVLDFAFHTVPNCMFSLLVLAALFALFDWLLLRRAIVR